MGSIRVRPLLDGETEAVVHLWGETKRDAYPYLPLEQGRTFEEDLAFWRGHLAPRCAFWVAEGEGALLGFLALAGSYLDRLYVHPRRQRRGVGVALLAKAKELSPAGLELHTHVKNAAARAFYEKHGFSAVRFGVSPPPESEPDVEYHWRP